MRGKLWAPGMICFVVFLLITTGGILTGGASAASNHTLIVDDDGGDSVDYTGIQPAIDNASNGMRIEVRPGTYREEVVLDKNITLVAPDGATLNGSGIPSTDEESKGIDESEGIIIPSGQGLHPVIKGFTIRGYVIGINARETAGDWTIQNTTIRPTGSFASAIGAWKTSGHWTIQDVTINHEGTEGYGVYAFESTGDWTVENSTVRSVPEEYSSIIADYATGNWTVRNVFITDSGYGVEADYAEGAWRLANVTISNSSSAGVYGVDLTGAWKIQESRIINSGVGDSTFGPGVFAPNASGDWSIRETVIKDSLGAGVYAEVASGNWTIRGSTLRQNKPAVLAGGTSGSWTVNRTTIANNTVASFLSNTSGIFAIGATRRGTATQNWWGNATGPDTTDCTGNVTCTNWLLRPSSAPPGQVTGWPMERHDLRNTGHTTASGPVETVSQRWNFSTGGTVEAEPVVVNGTAYIASWDNTLYALDAATGKVKWTFTTRGVLRGSPTVKNGRVYVGSGDHTVYAIDAETGTTKWTFGGAQDIYTPTTVTNGIVYISDYNDDGLYALHANNGTVKWKTSRISSDDSIAVKNGILFASDWGELTAVYASNGTPKWRYSGVFDQVSSPAIAGNTAFFGNGRYVVAVNTTDGSMEWRYKTGAVVVGSPAVVDGTVYIGSENVTALDADSGRIEWQTDRYKRTKASPVVADGVVYLGTTVDGSNRAFALNATSGASIWNRSVGSSGVWSLSVQNGTLFLGTDNEVIALSSSGDGSAAPAAAFTVTPSNVTIGTPIRFNASSATDNGSIERYDWQLGDGTTARGVVFNHTYQRPGTYPVTLTVTDDQNNSATTTTNLTVRPTERLVVDADGEVGNYTVIANAVNNASDGALIEVRPGTYEETIHVDRNVTIVAPAGATVARGGSSLLAAFQIEGGAEPIIQGFTVRDFDTGVLARGTGGDWTVQNLTTPGVHTAINAFDSTGDWRVTGLNHSGPGILEGATGINARLSTGNWTVTNSRVASVGRGVDAYGTPGTWTLHNVTFRNLGIALDAGASTGNWTMSNSRVEHADYSVLAVNTTRDWTVRNLTAVSAGRLQARGSEGDWTLRNLTLRRSEGIGADETEGNWTIDTVSVTAGMDAALSARRSTGAWSVRNATLAGHTLGIRAANAKGDWRATNLSIVNTTTAGIDATATTGNWTLRTARITNSTVGIDTSEASGDWHLNRSTLTQHRIGIVANRTHGTWAAVKTQINSNRYGVTAVRADGNWSLTDTVIQYNERGGLIVPRTTGNWRLSNVSVTGNGNIGINASLSTGDWVVTNISAITYHGHGVKATDTSGAWEIHQSNILGNGIGITAVGAAPAGDARRNWWGQITGPTDRQCIGNVICENHLSERASEDATGIRVRLYNGSTRTPFSDVSVYVYEQSPGVDENVSLLTGNEHYDGTFLREAYRNATTGTDGIVILTGLVEGDHCLLIVPPLTNPRNVRSRCVRVSNGTLVNETFVITNDRFGPADWSHLQNDPQHTGATPVNGPRDDVTVKWLSTVRDPVLGSPVLANGTLYVGTEGGTLHAINPKTGAKIWNYSGNGTANGPAVRAGTVFFRTTDEVHAIDTESGTREWMTEIESGVHPRTSITVTNETVYVTVTRGDGNGGVIALDASTGEMVWEFNLSELGLAGARTTPTVANGIVYGGAPVEDLFDPRQNFYALDAATGDVLWDTFAGDTVHGAATVHNGRVYAPTLAGTVAVLTPFTGEKIPVGELTGVIKPDPESISDVINSPATTTNRLYVGVGGTTAAVPGAKGAVFGVDVATGEAVWNHTTKGGVIASPAVAQNSVYFASARSDGGKVYAFDDRSGEVLWTYATGEKIQASPVVSNDTVFVATSGARSGMVYALTERSWRDLSLSANGSVGEIGDVPYGSVHHSAIDTGDPTNGESYGAPIHYEATTFEGEAGDLFNVSAIGSEKGFAVYLLGPEQKVIARNGSFAPPDAYGLTEPYNINNIILPADGQYTVVVASNYPLGTLTDNALNYRLRVDSTRQLTVVTTNDSARIDLSEIKKGQTVKARLTGDIAESVDTLSADFGADVGDGRVRVTSMAERPRSLPAIESGDAPNAVYFSVVQTGVDSDAIVRGRITVRLSKTEVSDLDTVKAYRYHSGSWDVLPIRHVRETATGHIFRVETPGFSTFALITGNATEATPTPTEDRSRKIVDMPGFGGSIAIIGIILFVVLAYRRSL